MWNGIYIRMYMDHTHMCEKKMESFRKESCVRGYHIYRELWEAAIREDARQRPSRIRNTTDWFQIPQQSQDFSTFGYFLFAWKCENYSTILLFDVENISRVKFST